MGIQLFYLGKGFKMTENELIIEYLTDLFAKEAASGDFEKSTQILNLIKILKGRIEG